VFLNALTTTCGAQISSLILDKSNLEKNTIGFDSHYYAFCRNLITLLGFSKVLRTLSFASCNMSKEAVLAIGEGLQKNTKLTSLNLKGNQITFGGLTELINAFYENRRLSLKHLDLSVNSICDEAGVELSRCLTNLKKLETINLKNNSLGFDSSDSLLFLVKENHTICKCNVELNMIKYASIVEIEKTCKQNKQVMSTIDLPKIKKEIKGLKRLRCKESCKIEDLNSKVEY